MRGRIEIQTNGEIYQADGDFTYDRGRPNRRTIFGADGRIHGYKETPREAFIQGTIADRGNLDLDAVERFDDATVTLSLANGETVVLTDAWYAGNGGPFRFVGTHVDETA
jgi:hypothetical protein